MRDITFLGAAGEVTGSSYLLTSDDNKKVLVDLGMFQGIKEVAALNYNPLGFRPSELSAVFLTHAHLDHCGRLPLLVQTGYFGKIYMTAPTFALVEVVLSDAANIAKNNPKNPPLYSSDDVEKVIKLMEVVDYEQPISVDGFTAMFQDAGHILGSASVLLTEKTSNQTIVFSGDLGNSPEDIVKPTVYIDEADIVVMETTYGDKVHPKEDVSGIIAEEINTIERIGGVLLIPAFSLERTQELLHRIHHLKKDEKIKMDTPVFMDSPMGIRATTIFKDFRSFYNDELQSHTDDPFSFEGLVVTQDQKDSKDIIKAMNPKVIIAGSGMMSGGRILQHALNYLPQNSTRLLFVGYQAEETLGREILGGKRHVRIMNRQITIRAQIREIESMSSHADQPKLLTWLQHIQQVKKVFLIHGDTQQRISFGEKIKQIGFTDVTLPQNGDQKSLSTPGSSRF